VARAGYSAGDGSHYFEIPQSGIQSALLSLSSTQGNTGIAGVDHLDVLNGEVGPSTLTSTGTIDFSDPNLNDTHSIQSVTYTGGGTELGTLALVRTTDTTGTGTGGQFVWTYTADPATVKAALDGTASHSKVETFDVVISDGHDGGTVTQQVSVTLTEPTVTVTVLTPDGLDFHTHNALKEMGAGINQSGIQSGGSSTSFTVLDSADDRKFVIDGNSFTYSDGAVTGGTVTAFHEFKADGTTALADFTGLSVNAATWMSAVQQDAHGDKTAAEALTSAYAYNFIGGPGADNFGSAGQADTLSGTGKDFFDGGGAPAGSHDTLTGGAGSTFVFAQGYGALTITNFDQASGAFTRSDGDHIELDGFTGNPTVTYVNGNTVADYGHGDILTLLNVNPADINDSDFIKNGGNGNGNNQPAIGGANNAITYIGTPVLLDPSVAVTDATATVTSVNVWISSGYQVGDELTINGATHGDITNSHGTISYNFDSTNVDPNQHGIYLYASTGSPTLSDFDAALHLIQFSTMASDPTAGGTDTSRTVTWAAHDSADAYSPTATTTVALNIVPLLNSMTLTVGEGGTTVLSNADFSVTDPGHTSFTYSLHDNVAGGQFEVFNGHNWVSAPTGGFTTEQIAAGHVEFVQDGTATTPSFSIHVSDGSNASPDIAPTVHFTNTPVITVSGLNGDHNAVEGQQLTAAVTEPNASGITYTWTVGGTAVQGDTGNTYTPTEADDGKAISVSASFTNGGGDHETGSASAGVVAEAPTSHPAPLIVTDDFHIVKDDRTTTITGLHVFDTDPAASTETFTITAATGATGSHVTPLTDSGSLTHINDDLATGVTYNPGSPQPAADKVAVTVTDGFGGTDTVNFVFNQGGSGPGITLTGTAGKDVIFATGNSDILTGGGGQDQFVFKPTSGDDAVQHTITDFVVGLDKIDLRLFHNITPRDGVSETQSGNDTLVTLDSHDTLLLKNVIATNLHANDFLIAPT
jgi:hypothetical protein